MAVTRRRSLVPVSAKKLIHEQTPDKYIKTRPGPMGRRLSYVETGYVIHKLNQIFNYNWNFEISEQTIGKKQIYVKGKLTGNLIKPDGEFFSITKEQFGGVDIKYNRSTEVPVSIADDLKAAGSDALKKCASLFGIAQDVFWPAGEFDEEEEEPVRAAPKPQATQPSGLVNGMQIGMIKKLLERKGYTEESLKGKYEVDELDDLTIDQGDTIIANLNKLPDALEPIVDVDEIAKEI